MNGRLPKIVFRERLAAALERRRGFARVHAAWRLCHHVHDGLPGLEIEVYGDVALVRTTDAETDARIGDAVDFLNAELKPKAVLLKNHFALRQSRGLELSDSVLAGSLARDIIEIAESGFRYAHDAAGFDFFPLRDRPLRLWFNAALVPDCGNEKGDEKRTAQDDGKPGRRALSVGMDNFLSIEAEAAGVGAEHVPSAGLGLAEATARLRDLAREGRHGFAAAALDMGFVGNASKNKKALFHLWHHALSLLEDGATLALKTRHGKDLAPLLGTLCAKTGVELRLTRIEAYGPDFPLAFGRAETAGRDEYWLCGITRRRR